MPLPVPDPLETATTTFFDVLLDTVVSLLPAKLT